MATLFANMATFFESLLKHYFITLSGLFGVKKQVIHIVLIQPMVFQFNNTFCTYSNHIFFLKRSFFTIERKQFTIFNYSVTNVTQVHKK